MFGMILIMIMWVTGFKNIPKCAYVIKVWSLTRAH